jgi:GNAT superfamily N-acetyltransferase
VNIKYTNFLTAEQYNNLRLSVKWAERHIDQAQAAVTGNRYFCTAYVDDLPVGMARIISDGGCICYVADMIVRPEYQHKGIGSAIMNHLLAEIKADMQEGYFIDLVLLSALGKEPFYERFGFEARPDSHFGHGMGQWIVKNTEEGE